MQKESRAVCAAARLRGAQRARESRGRFDSLAPPLLRLVHDDIERILLDEAEIREGIERVAAEVVVAVYRHDEPTVIAVLGGSVVFVADLIRRLPIPLRLAFVQAESYRRGTQGGELELVGLPPAAELRGRRILLVDDILDSGRTLAAIRAEILARGARDVRTCVLLDKPARRVVEIVPDHVAFEVADLFVVGFGLDYAGRYRNLPYVGALKPRVFAAASSTGGGSQR
jgi:hypoxanthine phosphoribosyltransferase